MEPLHIAAENGHVEVVQALLDRGADKEAVDNDGWTPLHISAQNGHREVVQALLERGADKEAVENSSGATALHIAAANGHLGVVQAFLDRGADKEAADKDGWTPLYFAAANGHLEVVQFLLDRGADKEAASKDGWTPLHIATEHSHIDVVSHLLEAGGSDEARTNAGLTPLHLAAKKNDKVTVECLLARKAKVNALSDGKETPLLLAARQGHADMVTLLIANEAHIEARDVHGDTPLHAAAAANKVDVISRLLEKKGSTESLNGSDATPLWVAARAGSFDAVSALVTRGAKLDATNRYGSTALHAAAHNGELDTVKHLVGLGANVEGGQTHSNEQPNHSEHQSVVHQMRNDGADVTSLNPQLGWTELHLEAAVGSEADVKRLLEHRLNPSKRDVGGNTPLILACMQGRVEIAEILLDHKSDVEAVDEKGRTALYHCVLKGFVELASLLVKHGANPKAMSKEGLTPLTLARKKGMAPMHSLLQGAVGRRREPSTSSILDELPKNEVVTGNAKSPELLKAGSRNQVGPSESDMLDGNPVKEGEKIQRLSLHSEKALEECKSSMREEMERQLSTGPTGKRQKSVRRNSAGQLGKVPSVARLRSASSRLQGPAKQLFEAAADGDVDKVHCILNAHPNDHKTMLSWEDPDEKITVAQKAYGTTKEQIHICHLFAQAGANMDFLLEKGWTPLHVAAASGDLPKMNELLDAKVDTDAVHENDGQWSPLDYAATWGQPEAAQLLLERGAKIEGVASSGFTPLHSSCLWEWPGVTGVLLEHGANVNAVTTAEDCVGGTPLHLAARNSEGGNVALLLAQGANIKAMSDEGDALKIAIDNKKPNVVVVLLQHLAKSWGPSRQATPLLAAAVNNHLDVVRFLLDQGGNVAAANCHPNVVKCLKEQPAFRDATEEDLKDNNRLKFLKEFHNRKIESEAYEAALSQGKTTEQEEMLWTRAKGFPEILEFRSHEMELLSSLPIVRNCVNHILRVPRVALVVVLDGSVLFALIVLYVASSWLFQHEGPLTKMDFGLASGLILCGTYTLLRECVQAAVMYKLGVLVSMVTSVWNWIDVLSAASAFVLAGMGLAGEDLTTTSTFRLVAAFGAVPIWGQVLGYVKVLSKDFATFVMALLQIAKDLRSFLVVLGIVLLLFTNLLFVVSHPRTDGSFGDEEDEEPFRTVWEALLTSYRMFFGDFDRDWFAAAPDEVSRQFTVLTFAAFLLVLNILLLNVLIAVVNNSYQSSTKKSLRLFYRARLELAAELQALLDVDFSKSADSKSAGTFLHEAILDRCVQLLLLEPKRVTDRLSPEAQQYDDRLDLYNSRKKKLRRVFYVLLFPVLLPVLFLDGLTWLLLRYAFKDSGKSQTDDSSQKEDLLAVQETVDEKMGSFEAKVDSLESTVGFLKVNTASLEANMASLEANMGSLEANMISLETNMISLEANMTSLDGKLSFLKDDIGEKFYRLEQLVTPLKAQSPKSGQEELDAPKEEEGKKENDAGDEAPFAPTTTE
eukprot:scaffold455_cov160-Pinguiococcus_pyrenoidosus.AAC.3